MYVKTVCLHIMYVKTVCLHIMYVKTVCLHIMYVKTVCLYIMYVKTVHYVCHSMAVCTYDIILYQYKQKVYILPREPSAATETH